MTSKSRPYEDLEFLAPGRDQPSFRLQLSRGIRHLSGRLISALTTAHEPKVHKIRTRDGQTRFDAYDPVTNEHIRAVSEENVRIWLEQRHNTM